MAAEQRDWAALAEQYSIDYEAEQISPADPVEAQILAALGHDTAHVDDISRTTGLDISALLSTLLLMELKGLVQAAGPMLYRRAHTR